MVIQSALLVVPDHPFQENDCNTLDPIKKGSLRSPSQI